MSQRNINPTVVGEAIGTSDIYVAQVTVDTDAAYTTETPESLAPTATIARETTVNTKTRYYSNAALFTDTSEGESKVTIVIPGLTVKGRASLLGKTYDDATGQMFDNGEAEPPYFALAYSVDRPDGVKEFVWLSKGKFSIPKDEAETKTGDINEKTLSIEFTAVRTIRKFQLEPKDQENNKPGKTGGVKAVMADTSDEAFTGAETWFDSVKTPPAIVAG